MDPLGEFFAEYGGLLAEGVWASLVMTVASTFFAYVIGLPLGIWFHLTKEDGLRPNRVVNVVLGWVINIGRSVPFIILLVALIPFTRMVMGTSIGIAGAIVPLTVCAAPFVARIVEQSLAEVDGGLIEAAYSFGASDLQIVMKVMLVESLPSIVRGVAISFVTLFGYVAMAGTVGAGGLGSIAIRYGYQRWNTTMMVVSVVLCVVFVVAFQSLGDYAAKRIDHRTR